VGRKRCRRFGNVDSFFSAGKPDQPKGGGKNQATSAIKVNGERPVCQAKKKKKKKKKP